MKTTDMSNIDSYKEAIRAIQNVLSQSIKNKLFYKELNYDEILRVNELESANLLIAAELLHKVMETLLLENACKNQAYFFILENDLLGEFARYCKDNPTETFYH